MRVVFVILILLVLSCNSKIEEQLVVLDFESDLIPEGIAIDQESGTIFLSSLKKNKIVKCKLDGSESGTFIESNQYDYLSGFGMTIKGDTLYALGNSSEKNNTSILLLLDKNSGELINSYSLNDTSFIYLNDIAISSNNDIYITDSESNKVYTLNNFSRKLEVFLEDDQIQYSNGISISNNDKYLYLASYYNGIRVFDIESKKILNSANGDYGKIDGMKFYENSLYGISNQRNEKRERIKSKSGVFQYYLNDNGTAIIKKEKIIPYEDYFGVATTFAIHNGYIYFIVNSQIENLDLANQIIDTNKLQPYILMKRKLN